ncbi:calpain-9-like isoform X2 [Tachypleus tridentatus]
MGQTFGDKAEKSDSIIISQKRFKNTDALGTGCYDYHYFRQLCREQGRLFEDSDFLPTNKILFGKNKASSTLITWMRPYEICTRPKFVSDDGTRCDIEQGDFGDNCLLAAISCLTLTPKFLDRVVPSDQSFGPGYCGIFRFRFWKFGEWVEIIVDDRLPTYRGRLSYLHSADPTEFWVALLEKAYAKFHGSYEHLQKGQTGKVLQDLTGGIAQSFQLVEHNQHVVYQMVNSSVPRSTLLAVSIQTDHRNSMRLRNGLCTHHAYSVTGIARVRTHNGDIPLVRLRNPCGKGEWNGTWSDRSWEWDKLPERDKEMLSMRIRNDGEFWMSFDDFLKNFTHLYLIHIGPDDWMQETSLHNKRPWRAVLARRRWRSGFNAGGGPFYIETTAMNPQFHIHIPKNGAKKCHVVVSVTQQYTPGQMTENGKNNSFHSIGFTVYEVPPNIIRVTTQFLLTHQPLDVTTHSVSRETVTFFTLPPGDFVIVPCTENPNCETRFLLRILTDEQSNIWEVNEDNLIYRELNFSKPGELITTKNGHNIITRIMHKLPGELDAESLLKILTACWRPLHILAEKPTLDLCRHLVMLRDPHISGKIAFKEIPGLLYTLQFWRAVFLKFEQHHRGRTSSFHLRPLLWEAGVTVSNKVLESLIIRFVKKSVVTLEDFLLTLVKLYLAHERYKTIERKMRENSLSLEEMILMTVYS